MSQERQEMESNDRINTELKEASQKVFYLQNILIIGTDNSYGIDLHTHWKCLNSNNNDRQKHVIQNELLLYGYILIKLILVTLLQRKSIHLYINLSIWIIS